MTISGTETFDPTADLDRSTLRFGSPDAVTRGGGARPASGVTDDGLGVRAGDFEADGDATVVWFRLEDAGLADGGTAGALFGKTVDGLPVYGTDDVRVR